MSLKDQFLLTPDVTYLNFGAFGACPKPIFEVYQNFQRQLELQPTQFIVKDGPALLLESKKALANYIHCEANDLIYITNPTYGVNIVARNLPLEPGDEVLTTNLEYGACDRTWRFFCAEKGVNYVHASITLPILSEDQFLEDFWRAATPKTKVLFISQITSMTALSFPMERLCQEARQRGLIIVIDGAHVPGHIPLNISEMEVDFYVGACHKWMMTPKGSSFLWTNPKYQDLMKPFVVSWGAEPVSPGISPYIDAHQYIGTRDYAAYLTIPTAIRFMEENNWPLVAEHGRKVVQDYLPKFCDLAESEPLAPNEFIVQMGSIPIKSENPVELKRSLLEDYKIEVPVFAQNGRQYIRYSYNGFNNPEDLEGLYEALVELKEKGEIGSV